MATPNGQGENQSWTVKYPDKDPITIAAGSPEAESFNESWHAADNRNNAAPGEEAEAATRTTTGTDNTQPSGDPTTGAESTPDNQSFKPIEGALKPNQAVIVNNRLVWSDGMETLYATPSGRGANQSWTIQNSLGATVSDVAAGSPAARNLNTAWGLANSTPPPAGVAAGSQAHINSLGAPREQNGKTASLLARESMQNSASNLPAEGKAYIDPQNQLVWTENGKTLFATAVGSGPNKSWSIQDQNGKVVTELTAGSDSVKQMDAAWLQASKNNPKAASTASTAMQTHSATTLPDNFDSLSAAQQAELLFDSDRPANTRANGTQIGDQQQLWIDNFTQIPEPPNNAPQGAAAQLLNTHIESQLKILRQMPPNIRNNTLNAMVGSGDGAHVATLLPSLVESNDVSATFALELGDRLVKRGDIPQFRNMDIGGSGTAIPPLDGLGMRGLMSVSEAFGGVMDAVDLAMTPAALAGALVEYGETGDAAQLVTNLTGTAVAAGATIAGMAAGGPLGAVVGLVVGALGEAMVHGFKGGVEGYVKEYIRSGDKWQAEKSAWSSSGKAFVKFWEDMGNGIKNMFAEQKDRTPEQQRTMLLAGGLPVPEEDSEPSELFVAIQAELAKRTPEKRAQVEASLGEIAVSTVQLNPRELSASVEGMTTDAAKTLLLAYGSQVDGPQSRARVFDAAAIDRMIADGVIAWNPDPQVAGFELRPETHAADRGAMGNSTSQIPSRWERLETEYLPGEALRSMGIWPEAYESVFGTTRPTYTDLYNAIEAGRIRVMTDSTSDGDTARFWYIANTEEFPQGDLAHNSVI